MEAIELLSRVYLLKFSIFNVPSFRRRRIICYFFLLLHTLITNTTRKVLLVKNK